MLGKFQLSITLGNEAMQTASDLALAMRQVADRLEREAEFQGWIFDANGNAVGSFTATERS